MKSNHHRSGKGVRYDVLGRLVLEKRVRDDVSLRAAAVDTGISPSSLSRIENGKTCQAEHVVTLARWLGVPVERFTGTIPENIPRAVKAMLLSDPHLGKDEANALGSTFSSLYRQMSSQK
jgi:transcriptional regulator with XRE-family HTH domain